MATALATPMKAALLTLTACGWGCTVWRSIPKAPCASAMAGGCVRATPTPHVPLLAAEQVPPVGVEARTSDGAETPAAGFGASGVATAEAGAPPGFRPRQRTFALRIEVDFAFPVVLEAPGTGIRGTIGAGTSLRFASRSGFGGVLAISGAVDLDLSREVVKTARVEAWFADLAALYRLRPIGSDSAGIGIDLSLGASYADLVWNAGHGAYRYDGGWFGGGPSATLVTPYDPPPQSFTTGSRVGPMVGLGIDGRLGRLVIGVNVAYRALVYHDTAAPIAAEPVAVHTVTFALHFGFGILH